MSFGERAALEGVLCQVKPQLAIEIGTAEGGSLSRIAAHSAEVHSFDLVAPDTSVIDAPHVSYHAGDSHQLLPAALEQFASEGRNVDFVLVDGDHSSEGVKQDIEDLFRSDAVADTAIVIHDTGNEQVRAGLDAVQYAAFAKVAYVDLDFVGGQIYLEPHLHNEIWGGLGLVLVDVARQGFFREPVIEDRYLRAAQMLVEARDAAEARERGPQGPPVPAPVADQAGLEEKLTARIVELEEEVLRLTSVAAHHEALWRSMMDSASWRVTSPLRAAVKRSRSLRQG
jgi:hypothetical protein